MANRKVILVTGVADFWGAQVAARLAGEAGTHTGDDSRNGGLPREQAHIIGLDAEPPAQEIKGLDFVQADIRNPLLVDLLREEAVDTVCHLVFKESDRPNEACFDLNVLGTMKVLGACAEAGVRKVVLLSSTAVYGAQPTNSAYLTEQHPLNGSRSWGFTRDLVEIEAFCNGFQRQMPEMILTILRFPGIVGPTVDTPLTRFLREPRAPILLGFDPMMQVIHERDAVEAIAYAVLNDAPGAFNVAADGVLPLTRLMALAAKLPIPIFHLFAYWGVNASGPLAASRYFPFDLDYLRYSWVGDLARQRDELGFTPRYTAEEALREFAGQQRLRRYVTDSSAMDYDRERLRDTIERRRRLRQQQGANEAGRVEEEEHEQ